MYSEVEDLNLNLLILEMFPKGKQLLPELINELKFRVRYAKRDV